MMFAVALVAAIVADDKGIAVTRQEERVAGAQQCRSEHPTGSGWCNGNTEAANNATPAPDSAAQVVQFGAAAESSVVHRSSDCVRFAVPTGDRMAAHRRLDRRRVYLCGGGLRKRVEPSSFGGEIIARKV
jgi:hypothetical protein